MEKLNLSDGEYRVASIVWANGTISSGELVNQCKELYGWKKSTTYTVLKKLCTKGVLKNENSVVFAIVQQDQIQKFESTKIINKTFGGSLPQFITAFMSGKTITEQEAEEIKQLIDRFKKEV